MSKHKKDSRSIRELLNDEGVAAVLSLSRATVWKLLAAGKLPRPIHLGRSARWRAAELKAWIAAGCPQVDRWAYEVIRNNEGQL